MNKVRVYVASPYTNGWMPENVKRQMDVGNELMDMGFYPFVPLLYHFMEIYYARKDTDWVEFDLAFLEVCDAVLRLKPVDENGVEIESTGSDREEARARELGIPVFYSVSDLRDYFSEMTAEENKTSLIDRR